ncbi:OsmC family protein [Pantoea sp. 1.19]|uniref:OsmC family protein n=1 Tax=Pantoea sp. 1.19 TaxID=1925589 RepID=UPI000948E7EE|nr:OsmC family protein [Pantoea sp. 1.19]
MAIHNQGSAHWEGDIQGKGLISTGSGALKQQPYGFGTRFDGKPGTNPEELIGAAHAACFSMALSLFLKEQGGYTAKSIETTADVVLEKQGGGFAITKIALKSVVELPGADEKKFEEIILNAKANCPVSQVLNAEITLDYDLLN